MIAKIKSSASPSRSARILTGGAFVLGVSLMMNALTHSSAFAEGFTGGADRLKKFLVQEKVVTQLQMMETLGWRKGATPVRPWSDTSWPDLLGSIAQPYDGLSLVRTNGWKQNRSEIMNRKRLEKVAAWASMSEEELGDLSPAEKYDILTGDTDFTFTRKVVDKVTETWSKGNAALWAGICHGWSPAALNYPRPMKMVRVQAPNGKMIPFYPSDIKALMSFLWAQSNAGNNVIFDGVRCESSKEDIKNKEKRMLDPNCNDSNPGSFHLLVTNQINLNQKGFVIERKFNHEIFNQPAYKYSYKYFNPFTGEEKKTLAEAVQSRHSVRDCTVDRNEGVGRPGTWGNGKACLPFANFRDPRTVSIVGVIMKVWYLQEIEPEHREKVSTKEDNIQSVTVQYDLELDAAGNVIGGEWRRYLDPRRPNLAENLSYEHPDFIWVTPAGLKATAWADYKVSDVAWDGSREPLPLEIREAAFEAATNTLPKEWKVFNHIMPQPLAKIVDELNRLSQ